MFIFESNTNPSGKSVNKKLNFKLDNEFFEFIGGYRDILRRVANFCFNKGYVFENTYDEKYVFNKLKEKSFSLSSFHKLPNGMYIGGFDHANNSSILRISNKWLSSIGKLESLNLEDESSSIDTESKTIIKNYQKLFDDIKKASTDIYNCLTSTTYLCNKLNKIDKSYFQEYLDFLRVGPVNDLRRDVATYLIDNNITPTILDEIIKKHKKEKPNQLRAWLNPYKILHPIINQEYKNFDEGMEILANEISKSNGGMKWKINNFNGPQNQGSENYWIAFYNKSLLSQANSLQLFISFKQGQCVYGIYKHNGTEYLVGPETYTDWESFSSFISENIHYILEDKKSTEVASTETSTDLGESEEGVTPFTIMFPKDFKASQAQEEKETKVLEPAERNPFGGESKELGDEFNSSALFVVGASGAGKSTRILKLLRQHNHKIILIGAENAPSPNLLLDYDQNEGYVPSDIAEFIISAKNDPTHFYTVIFDECHEYIDEIKRSILHAISTKRGEKRFFGVRKSVRGFFEDLETYETTSKIVPANVGFIFISSKPDVFEYHADFMGRVDKFEVNREHPYPTYPDIKYIKDILNRQDQL